MNEHVQTLVDAAANSTLAVLHYRKGATRRNIEPRLVEPYSFSDGVQDLMVKCWQLEQGGDGEKCGWRFFMAHKIDGVEPTSIRFKPRRRITLPTGEISSSAQPSPHWNEEGRRAYRDLVGDALADGEISPDEQGEIKSLKLQHGLADDDIRFVHASVYHRCLGAVLDDGFVTDVEIDQIRFLHTAMRSLGWAVGD